MESTSFMITRNGSETEICQDSDLSFAQSFDANAMEGSTTRRNAITNTDWGLEIMAQSLGLRAQELNKLNISLKAQLGMLHLL